MFLYFGSKRSARVGILCSIRGSLREMNLRPSRLDQKLIQGIPDAQALGVQVSHRGLQVLVTNRGLDGPRIRATLQAVGA